jgi:hypothetical protein
MIGLALCVALFAPAWTEDAVTRDLKGGERAGYEDHDVDRFLARFAPEAQWVQGRRAAADAYDVRLGMKVARRWLRIERAGPPEQRRLEFVEVSAALDADPPTVTLVESLAGLGMRQLVKVRFTLKKSPKGWQIVERRQWPVEDRSGPIPVLYNDAYWLEADAVLDNPGTDTAAERLDALLSAHRFAELFDLAGWLIRQPNAPMRAWTERARAAWRLGKVDVARAAAKAARAQRANPGVPANLLNAPKR